MPTTGGGINGVGWEFSPEYCKRTTPTNVYLKQALLGENEKIVLK